MNFPPRPAMVFRAKEDAEDANDAAETKEATLAVSSSSRREVNRDDSVNCEESIEEASEATLGAGERACCAEPNAQPSIPERRESATEP